GWEIRARRGVARENRKRAAMQVELARRGDRALDREPRQLVTEDDAVRVRGQHPRRQTLVERMDVVAGERLQQAKLGVRRNDGYGLEDVLGRCAQLRRAREDR